MAIQSETESIIIKTLGSFSIQRGRILLSETDDRSKKIWKLLEYLVHNRGRIVSKEELIGLLWGEEGDLEENLGALKTLLHRARKLLDQLASESGRVMILRCEGGYTWNSHLPLQLDTDQFTALVESVQSIDLPEEKLNAALRAMALYRGRYLSGQYDKEEWASSAADRYESLYLACYNLAIQILVGEENYDQIVFLSRHAMGIAPTQESFYYNEISALIAKGQDKEALVAYERAMDLFYQVYRRTPSCRLRCLYRKINRAENEIANDLTAVREKLSEDAPVNAVRCEYDTFHALYLQGSAGLFAKASTPCYLILLTVTADDSSREIPPPKVLDRSIGALEEELRRDLPPGTVYTRYSITQLLAISHFSDETALYDTLDKMRRRLSAREVAVVYRIELI